MTRYYLSMIEDPRNHLRALLERIGRLLAQQDWQQDLNPAQRSALAYLSRANRFSRSPSQVADYLMATRGTVSQTLKALARKGLVQETPVAGDKRSIVYEVTEAGWAAQRSEGPLDAALSNLTEKQAHGLGERLEGLLQDALQAQGNRPFGLCRNCRYHRRHDQGSYCSLLNEPLTEPEADLICHEQQPV